MNTSGSILGFRQDNRYQELGVETGFPGLYCSQIWGFFLRILGIPAQLRWWGFSRRKLLRFDRKEETG